MKRGIITLGVLILFFLNSTWGQLAARIRAYSETTVSDVHISVYKSPFSTLQYYKEAETNRDVFIYKNKKYIMPILANPNGAIEYSVNDMKVAGDCCFFCGKMVTPTEPHLPPPIIDRSASFDEEGYIACLCLDSIDDLLNPNVRCRFYLIHNTSEMTKMAIYSYSGDTAIAMIGKYDNHDRTSCLVSVTSTGSTWQNYVYYFTDTTETLTDIVLTDKSLVTASRFGGENYTFGVRYVNLSDFFYDNITDYKTLNKFNTVNMVDGSPDHLQVTWHRNYATMRLVAMPNSNDVTLAHEGHFFYDQQGNYYSYFSLYYIDGSNPYSIYMSKARHKPCYYYPVEMFKDMQYVPQNDQIALLENHPSAYHKGAFTLFSWNSWTVNSLASTEFGMTDMIVTANKYIWTGGTNQTNNCIYQYNQDISSTATCLPPASNQCLTLSPLPDNIQSTTEIERDYKKKEWKYKFRVVPFITHYEIKCQNRLLDQ